MITCPVQNSLKLIGGKWKISILYSLRNEPIRFGALRRLHAPITQQMLSKQLREMELENLINRRVFEVIPPKVEYRLTPLGDSLVVALDALRDWAMDNNADVEATIEDYKLREKEEALQNF